MTQAPRYAWDLRRVNHLARVDAYYGGHARVKHESLHVPQQAHFAVQPPVAAAVAAAESAEDQQQRQSKAQQRANRKRKREQVRQQELIAAGKFVPVDGALKRALVQAHSDLLDDAAGVQALQPAVSGSSSIGDGSESASAFPPLTLTNQLLSTDTLHANDTDDVQLARTTWGSAGVVLLPARSSFVQCDVRALPTGASSLGQFKLIVMDPPWENKSVARSKRYATFHHMELLKIDVAALADPHECVLGIWVTNRPQYSQFILEVLLPAWGFALHDTWYWLKVCANGDLVTPIASSHRLPFEKMVVAYRCAEPERRRVLLKRLGAKPKLLLSIPLRHSWKPPPESFFSDDGDDAGFEQDARRLELFARELRPQWTSVGNEVLIFQNASLFAFAQASSSDSSLPSAAAELESVGTC